MVREDEGTMQEESMMRQQGNSWNAELPNRFYYNGNFSIFTNQNKLLQLLGLNTQNDVEGELCLYHPKNT